MIKVSVVIENTSTCGMPVEHGLCLWIEAGECKFFFDLGQGTRFAENASAMGIDVNDADFVVVSHGHYDHGGGIGAFLSLNDHAKVVVNRNAFTDCYSMRDGRARYIGLDRELKGSVRMAYADGVMDLSPCGGLNPVDSRASCDKECGMILFQGADGHDFFSPANGRILKTGEDGLVPDGFAHEQSLIVRQGGSKVLFAGCAHSGIVNIMRRAERIMGEPLTHVVSGLHLKGVDDREFIAGLGKELLRHNCHYYTCHCIGKDAYAELKEIMGDSLEYIACGDVLYFS